MDGTKLLVADSKDTKLAEKAAIKLDVKPGEEGQFLKNLFNLIKKGADDTPLGAAAKILKDAEKPCIVYGQSFASNADENALSTLLEIAEVLDASLIGVKGNANSTAAAQLGLESPIATNGFKSAFIMLGDEDPSQKLIKTLEDIPFVVALSAYSSQLTGNADVVLPVTMWAEHFGTYLSMDGHLQKAPKALDAPEGVGTSIETLLKISEALSVEPSTDWLASISSRTPTVEIKEA
jgi:NADH dehydrogenase/NADH:ubiquinone oxidoreductase subunit G